MDIGLAIDTYIFEREITIRKQQESIRELSTPVLQLRDELLILPLVGAIDEQRSRLLTETLLKSIRDNRARVVVMDITGVRRLMDDFKIHSKFGSGTTITAIKWMT